MKCDVKIQTAMVQCWLMVYVLGLPIDVKPEVRSNIERQSSKRTKRFSFEPSTGFGKRSWTRPSLDELDNIPFDNIPSRLEGQRYSPYFVNRKRLSDIDEQLKSGLDTYTTGRQSLFEDGDGDYWRDDNEIPVGHDVMGSEPILDDGWPEDDHDAHAILSDKYNLLRRKYTYLTELFQRVLNKDLGEK